MGWLGVLDRHATKFLAASVFLALALPDLSSLARPLLMPAVWGILVLAMLRMDPVRKLKTPMLIFGSYVWLLGFCPLATFWVLQTLDMDTSGVGQAMMLAAAAPPLMSTPALAMIIGLDATLALFVLVIAMFLTPLFLPFMTLMMLGVSIEMSILEFSTRLFGVIGSAMAVTYMMRRFLAKSSLETIKGNANGLVVILMLVFAVAIMDGVTARLLAEPLFVMEVLGLSFLFQILIQAVTAACFLAFGKRTGLTLAFLAGNRNMGLLLAVLPAGLHPDIALYFALAQFPIFILPMLLKPLYARLLAVK